MGKSKLVIDPIRFMKQKEVTSSWFKGVVIDGKKKPFTGTICAATGFGKSMIIKIAKAALKDDMGNVIIIVPLTALKKQWEDKQLPNTTVFTIQYLLANQYLFDELECDVLLIDEIHVFAADVFRLCFKISRKKTLGLTATYERTDEKHKFIETVCPVLAEVPYAECVSKGWVEDVTEINFHVPMTSEEAEDYMQCEKMIRSINKFFNAYDIYGNEIYKYSSAHSNFTSALSNYSKLSTKDISSKANIWRNTVANRKNMLYNMGSKFKTTCELDKFFKDEVVIHFGKSIAMADRINDEIGVSCMVYHTKMQPQIMPVITKKSYSTLAGAMNFLEKDKSYKYNGTNEVGEHIVAASVQKKVTGKTLQSMILAEIAKPDSLITRIASVESLKIGIDIQNLSVGIVNARDSSPINYQQIRGRIARIMTDSLYKGMVKKGVLINVVSILPELYSNLSTQDQIWLSKAQPPNTTTVYSIKELEKLLEEPDLTKMTMDNVVRND